VAEVRVSGTFPLRDTNLALNMLASTYPIAVRKRLNGYWVTLERS
jgi:transmembrane sensor